MAAFFSAIALLPLSPQPPPPPPQLHILNNKNPLSLLPSSSSFSKKPSSFFSSPSPSPSPPRYTYQRITKCQAKNDEPSAAQVVYQGIYGPWSVDSFDIREVVLYRSGLVTAAASFVIAGSTALLPPLAADDNVLKQNLDILYTLGAGGLGLSLFLIHIYVNEIKRTLQALWGLGVIGSLATYLYLAQPVGQTLPQYVVDHPISVWFVGPLFAALTGLVFKEGLCYGKLEAGVLTFIIPSLLLGHLTGLMDDGLKLNLLGIWMLLFVVFAARKFTQPIKDDIGDKSVFIFNALSEKEKKALVDKLEEQKLSQEIN